LQSTVKLQTEYPSLEHISKTGKLKTTPFAQTRNFT